MAVSSRSEKLDTRLFRRLEMEGKRAIVDWCMEEGLIMSKYECPVCKKNMKLVSRKDRSDGFEWMCRKTGEDAHRIIRSIRKGSWFSESKMSVIDILVFSYLWVYQARSRLIRNEVQMVSDSTLVDWRSFCREVCIDAVVREQGMLGGEGKEVEIDESMFGKRKYNRGKRTKGTWVFGGIERGSQRCFFEIVPDRSEKTLFASIEKNILVGTTVISDCWKAYGGLENKGFHHLTVNHSIHFKDPDTGANTNLMEGTWSVIKREFRKSEHRNVNEVIFDSYFMEFIWRRNHRNDGQALMRSFLECVKSLYVPMERDSDLVDVEGEGDMEENMEA